MPPTQLTPTTLNRRLKDRVVLDAVIDGNERLTIRFAEGTVLVVSASSEGLVVRLGQAGEKDAAARPTKRQLDYLGFIAKYMQRYGGAPAESDMQRHFLVAGPTVNQMMQVLEKRGFITRQPGVGRSIRICVDLSAYGIVVGKG